MKNLHFGAGSKIDHMQKRPCKSDACKGVNVQLSITAVSGVLLNEVFFCLCLLEIFRI